MKLKKWGAFLLALCMIITMFPTTAMANEDSIAGPDAEKNVIENELIVQLPSSLDDMIDTSPSGWSAVRSETWEDGTILDFVMATQEFYDSSGEKMTETDTFQNNSQYTMKMIFQSFESYHGDYYYVLSGENNVYVELNGQRDSMNVTVDADTNGNPVITATYSFSIGTPIEEPSQEASYEFVVQNDSYEVTTQMDVVIGATTKYLLKLVETSPDGTKQPVSTDSMLLDYTTTKDLSEYLDMSVETYYGNYYMVSLTGKQMFNQNSECNFSFSSNGQVLKEGSVDFKFIEPTDITLNQSYDISDKKGQYLYYQYQPSKNGEQYYSLWLEGASASDTDDSTSVSTANGALTVYKSTEQKPIIFWVRPYYFSDSNTCFELVETKLVKEIEILPIPDTILEDIEENGEEADLRGIQFTVTYDDGSTDTHELGGLRFTTSEGFGDPFVVYRMDCRSEGNVYECYPHLDSNSIQISCWNPNSNYVSDTIELSKRSKVNITEGLNDVTGNLGNTEYNTVEKIAGKLTETIVSNKGYTADNTLLYDIEFETSEDGGKTWIPVTAENFPNEGIDVTLPYPEGTNAADYDFTVAHMFDEDVNGHKAGEVETPVVVEGTDGISFHLMGTSPVMIGYKKVEVTHTHSYGEWTYCKDGINHQRFCSCGEVQKEAHIWDEGKVTKEATKDEEGIKTYTCKICRATKTERIPKLTSSKPGDSTDSNTDTVSPKTRYSTNITLWISIMIMSIAGISCIYVVKRKTKSNH